MGAEINYWEAFGLEEPAGENETEVATPSEQPGGENETEIAAPSEDMEDIDPEQESETEVYEKDAEPDRGEEEKPDQPQTRQERARQAAARRQREQDAAIKAAVEAALQQERASREKEMTDFFAAAGLRDPNRENKPITNMEEFRQYQQTFTMKQAEADLRRGKLTPETLQQIVAQTPVVQQAQQLMQQAERDKQAAEQARVKAEIDAEITEIGKLDPTIKSLDDLLRSENGQRVYELTKKGNNLLDAYRLANIDRLTQRAANAAANQRAASDQSKAHLQATTARGKGSVDVPAAELAMYRQMMPKVSEAEIRRHYNNYIKSMK